MLGTKSSKKQLLKITSDFVEIMEFKKILKVINEKSKYFLSEDQSHYYDEVISTETWLNEKINYFDCI